MKNALIAATAALIASFPSYALAQAVPVPFNANATSSSADAGFLGTLAVVGDGGLYVSGQGYFDGGIFVPPFTPINMGLTGGYALTGDNAGNLTMRFQGVHLTSGWFEADNYVQTPVIYSTTSTLTVEDPTITLGYTVADAGFLGQVNIGAGSTIKNQCFNMCGLSSQTCNVLCPGVQGNSVCHAWAASSTLACDVVPDAGAVTINCAATVTGDAGVECWN